MEGRAIMAADNGGPAALDDTQTTGALIDKVEALARRCATLLGASQRVSAESGLSRTRLGSALAEALLAREALEAEARELALTGYRAVARPFARPRRYNRIARRIDSALERLGAFGRAAIIARSGLWRASGGGLNAMAAYTRRGGDPSVQPPALFDQAWYLRMRPDLLHAADGDDAPPAAPAHRRHQVLQQFERAAQVDGDLPVEPLTRDCIVGFRQFDRSVQHQYVDRRPGRQR